jgi:outer membrane receptor for monomeric catechols
MFKARTTRTRCVELICAAAMGVAISKQAIGQEQQLPQQPQQQQTLQPQPQPQSPESRPLPPVNVEKPAPRRDQPVAQTSKPQRGVQHARHARRSTQPRPAASRSATPTPSAAISANLAKEATEAAGYKPSTVSNLGPFGQTPILNVPYSVSVISRPLIENQQASVADDIFRIDPLIQQATTTARGLSPNPYIRGFLVPNSSGRGEDGMVEQTLFAVPLEDKERVEVYAGLTSFLYGATNVGGFINYVLKSQR